MAVRTTWICDGCDAELERRDGVGTDWKTISVEIQGTEGYPLCGSIEGDHRWLLCVPCQYQFAEAVMPKNWVREAAAK